MFIEHEIFPDGSYRDEIVKIPIDQFVEFLDKFIEEDRKQEIRQALVDDDQLQQLTFKRIASSALKHLARKALGKAGAALVDEGLGQAGALMNSFFGDDIGEIGEIAEGMDFGD
jgi:hypothetical protein